MTFQKVFTSSWLIFGIIVIGLLLWAGLSAPDAHAIVVVVPPTPTPIVDHKKDSKKDHYPIGAHIELHGAGGAWGAVQWQDSAGNWHDVEGWRGSLSGGGQSWWVAKKDFGTGPFRWVVSQSPTGPIVGMSQPFYLPTEANQVMVIAAP
jgi:hypothetical protein